MAVTLTVDALSAAVRLGDSPEELTEITRLLAYATEAVENYSPDAPETAQNEAVIRLAAQMFDQPNASRGAYANAMRNSGAARILMPYRIHRAGSTQDAIAIAQGAIGTLGNPVVDVEVSSGELIVTFNDGSTESHTLPAGQDAEDQVARDAAAAADGKADANAEMLIVLRNEVIAANKAGMDAQDTADANALAQSGHDGNVNAHHVPPMGGGGVVSESTRLPLGTVVMRMGWAQTQSVDDTIFTRANLHPTDARLRVQLPA